MTVVWVAAWATDYDGEGIVALAFASEELAREAGYDYVQRCSVISELPSPLRWVKRRLLWTDGVMGEETAYPDVDHFEQDARRAWIGTIRIDEGYAPFRRWIAADMWAPDTEENQRQWEALVASVNADPEQEGGYTYWEVPTPEANTYDAVSDYSGHAAGG